MQSVRVLLLLILVTTKLTSYATHIRGGSIGARHLSGRTYAVTFTAYRDVAGVVFADAGLLDFGDGQTFGGENNDIFPWEVERIDEQTEKWSFTITHEYTLSGQYLVSYTEDFRNEDVLNMISSGSTTFYVESLLFIDPTNPNSTPIVQNDAGFFAIAGKEFSANFAFYDSDGDSLAYHLVEPKQYERCVVSGYRSLIDPSLYDESTAGNEQGDGFPTLSTGIQSGNLVWDAPGLPGKYSVALMVEEYREINDDLVRIGFVTVDFQITVLSEEEAGISYTAKQIMLPFLGCVEEPFDFSEQVMIEHDDTHNMALTLFSDIDALLVNGLSIAEWNRQNGTSSQIYREDIVLDFSLTKEEMEQLSGLHTTVIKLDLDDGTISYAKGFLLGIGCEIVDTLTGYPDLATPVNERGLEFKLFKSGLRVFSESCHLEVHIMDISGKRLLVTDFYPENGEQLLEFPFENTRPYLLVFNDGTDFYSEKVMLSEN